MGVLHLHDDGVVDVVGVLLHQVVQAVGLEVLVIILVLGVGLDVEDDVGAHHLLLALGHGVAVGAGGLPLPGGVLTIGLGDHGDLVGHHEGGVEAHAELADDVDVVAGVLFFEVQAATLGDGAQIVFQIFGAHADAVIRNGDGAVLLVQAQPDGVVLFFQGYAVVGEGTEIQLVQRIAGVADQLTQKDHLVRINRIDHKIQKLFAFGFKLLHGHLAMPPNSVMLALATFEC